MSGIDEKTLAAAVEFTRNDLGEMGTNYPHVRALLAFAEAAIAPQQAAPMPGVKVKALEWEYGEGNYGGQQVWHTGDPWLFWIVKNTNSNHYVWCETLGLEGFVPASPVRSQFDNLEAAKAEAQADYERRILSALATPESGTSEPVPCKSCGGSGSVADYVGDAMRSVETPCYRCMGSGVAPAPSPAPVDGEAVRALLQDADWLDSYGRDCAEEGDADQEMTGLRLERIAGRIRAYLAALAAPEAGTGEPVAAFGEGRLVIDTGTAHGKPAVFIAPATLPGEVGTSAARENHPLDRLIGGEWYMTFPTDEQAKLVADALCNVHPAPAQAPVDGEAVRVMRESLKKIAAPYDGEDGRRLIPLAEIGAELRRRQKIAIDALAAAPSARKEP